MSLNTRGYSIIKQNYSDTEIQTLKKSLTVKAFVNKDFGAPSNPFPVYGESKKKLYIPRFYGIKHYGQPTENKLTNPKSVNLNFIKELRPKQLPIVAKYLDVVAPKNGIDNGGGGIISVPCGYGKTVLALYIAAKLNVKTLVIVHKGFLLDQWKERIEEFLPNTEIGRIQAKVANIENKDIVIGMLQSISMKEYDESIFKDFGLVIYDECHHLGAEVFSKALLKTNFKYLLGLSATPTRLDGLSKVFEWYLGDIVYSIKKRETENVDVKVIKYYDSDPKYSKVVLNQMRKPCMPIMITNITKFNKRLVLVINELKWCLEDGRKILLLSDRRDHLTELKKEIDKIEGYTAGFYLGGMKACDLEQTEEADVILGTFSMASEGFDCRYPLNTIILASPKSNIEQSVGRILRQEAKHRTKVPLIIDIDDDFSLFARQTIKRIKYYKKNKYNIKYYNQEGILTGSMLNVSGAAGENAVDDTAELEFLD
jgi:superfamily II DNA or RNA helicase